MAGRPRVMDAGLPRPEGPAAKRSPNSGITLPAVSILLATTPDPTAPRDPAIGTLDPTAHDPRGCRPARRGCGPSVTCLSSASPLSRFQFRAARPPAFWPHDLTLLAERPRARPSKSQLSPASEDESRRPSPRPAAPSFPGGGEGRGGRERGGCAPRPRVARPALGSHPSGGY